MIPYFTSTTNTAEATPLYWNDVTQRVDNLHDVTFYGLSRVVTSIDKFDSGHCLVVDNKIMRPAPGVTVPTISLNNTGGTRLITSKAVEGFKLTLSFPGGLYSVSDTAGYQPQTVSIGIGYRVHDPDNSADWTFLTFSDGTVSSNEFKVTAKQRAEIIKTIASPKLELNIYDIIVFRYTPSHAGNMKIVDECYVKEITEILYTSLKYNHTALLGVRIRATDQLQGSAPTITSLVKGTKIQVPSNQHLIERYDSNGNYNGAEVMNAYSAGWLDGKLSSVKTWTDNPVWCLYDLLTHPRYGLANYYRLADNKKGLMLANFYTMAKYCDEPIHYYDPEYSATANYYTSDGRTVNRRRPRFALNMVIDQAKTAADWIASICAVMRAVIYYQDGMLYLDIDRPKPVSQIFTMSSIKEFTQSGTSYKQIPNCYEVQWINPNMNYEIDSFRLEAPELQDNPNIEERKKALMLLGVTNFDQAKSMARFALLAGQARTKLVSFKTGTSGLRTGVTSVIGIQHDVPQWGWGGKVTAYDAGSYVVSLSSPFTPQAGKRYSIIYASQGTKVDINGETVKVSIIDNGDGTEQWQATLNAPADPPKVGDEYLIGETSNTVAPFRVLSIKRDSDELCEITAIEYSEEIYTKADDTSSLGVINTLNYSLLTNPSRASVQGVVAKQKYYQDSGGTWKTGVEIFYEPPKNSTFWRGAKLHWAKAGTALYSSLPDTNVTGMFYIAEIGESGDYQFVITSVYSTGQQTISDALSDFEKHPWVVVDLTTYAPNDAFLAGVKGLTIENSANDGTFVGKDCVVVWRSPTAIDAAIDSTIGDVITPVSSSSWFSHYIVDIYNIDGSLRRSTSGIQTERFVYTHEMNHSDVRVTRKFNVTVTAVDRVGRTSTPVTLTAYNPAPVALS